MGQAPQYEVQVHISARNELVGLPPKHRQEVEDKIIAVSEYEQPTEHSKASPLRNADNLFRIRVEDYRVLCQLNTGVLQVLKVDERDQQTYKKGLQEAQERAEDGL